MSSCRGNSKPRLLECPPHYSDAPPTEHPAPQSELHYNMGNAVLLVLLASVAFVGSGGFRGFAGFVGCSDCAVVGFLRNNTKREQQRTQP